jgi:trk system potassium uptake protein TrkA
MVEGGDLDRSELTLPRLVSLLRYGQPIRVSDEGGVLASFAVAPGSALDGATVAESVGWIEGATAVAVLRGGEMLVPRGPTRFQAGDQLIAVTTGEVRDRLREAAEG